MGASHVFIQSFCPNCSHNRSKLDMGHSLTFDVLPSELLLQMLDNACPEDVLSPKLTCRTFHSCLTIFLQLRRGLDDTVRDCPNHEVHRRRKGYYFWPSQHTCARVQTLRAHARLKADLESTKQRDKLLCIYWRRVKPINSFTDKQSLRSVPITDPLQCACITCDLFDSKSNCSQRPSHSRMSER